ncbi:hypothetical protein ADIARSV_3337 [Arcticibacter svalbardensis MN12-7]|uniref:DUF4876 domain-containing protein n=1 Tax=Arcticibacter svalbardensis MN12-7 TaxID=1150600 RepID=R9GP38_9SPHI|nr:DUF4876 domain-containing protein [Arcticibacter svalbardensis]EOR93488.1 hypothetical protein ADIARSV_3337 [Arcticibacter svalbardensis MN12-7]
MKKQILLLTALACVIFSCKKDDWNTVEPVNLVVSLAYTDEAAGLEMPKKDAEITLINLSNNETIQAKTNESGVASFVKISPGIYTIKGSITISAENYSTITGVKTEDDIVFNTNLSNQSVVEDNSSIEMKLSSGKIGDWLFKQIYYSGSHTTNGAVFRDCFVEIYNNSNSTLYADSLYFSQIIGVNNVTVNYPNIGYLSSNQFDWNQSLNMIGARANEDYVYANSMFMVPGTGKQYPVLPGKSFIIAVTAVNHKEPYVMNSGVAQNVGDPSLTVDLSTAEFEANLVSYNKSTTPYKWDVNNPAVPDLKVLYSNDNDLTFNAKGYEALVIFKVAATVNPATWPAYSSPNIRTITSTTQLYPQIPISTIIDAVELENPVSSLRVPKRLQNQLDAGPAYVPAGQYASQSLVRKTVKTVNGRRVLQDTNNSHNDFGYKERADASKSEASFNFTPLP